MEKNRAAVLLAPPVTAAAATVVAATVVAKVKPSVPVAVQQQVALAQLYQVLTASVLPMGRQVDAQMPIRTRETPPEILPLVPELVEPVPALTKSADWMAVRAGLWMKPSRQGGPACSQQLPVGDQFLTAHWPLHP